MAKALCKYSKDDIRTKFKKYVKLVDSPEFICKKCGRAANSEKTVCSPAKIPMN